jgi:type III pantothenate kinase
VLFAIDVGNTNVHLGLYHDGGWALSWRARTVADKMPDEYAVLVRNFLASAGLAYADVSGVAISSVVPALTESFTELSRRYLEIDPLVVNARVPCGITIAIDQPDQAGADRIVNAAAAAHLYGGDAVIVDFGTATTFDILTADRAYRGGAIAPGIRIAHDALVSRAARLHKVDLEPPPRAIGTNTIHAMQSGIFWGYVAMVEGMTARLTAEMRESGLVAHGSPIRVIATGGLAPLFRANTAVIDLIAPELTLEGLRIIWGMNGAMGR